MERDRRPRVMSAWGVERGRRGVWSVNQCVRRARVAVCARDARDTGAACVKLYTLDMLKSDNTAV